MNNQSSLVEKICNKTIAIIGLGYVGLPLARLFGTKYPTVGFDINKSRISELNNGTDTTLEVEDEILQSVLVQENPILSGSKGLFCSSNLQDIENANVYIVTVPTPVDKHNNPDLTPLYKASETVGKVLKRATSLFTNLRFILVLPKKNVFLSWRR